jgi:hypothetical protein
MENQTSPEVETNKEPEKEQSAEKISVSCVICGREILDVLTAISVGEESEPAHFDCVVTELAKDEELQPDEKIVYLGRGCFGIVQFRNPSSQSRIFVRKRIQLEDMEKRPQWRKSLTHKGDLTPPKRRKKLQDKNDKGESKGKRRDGRRRRRRKR